jgi:hypothetical protein
MNCWRVSTSQTWRRRETFRDHAINVKMCRETLFPNHKEQDRQCKYKLTLRRVYAITVVAEKQSVLHILCVCVSSLRYPALPSACAVLYCHRWPARLYNMFPHYLANGIIFRKKLRNTKCVFWFSPQVLPETFRVLRITERDKIINLCSLHVKYRHSSSMLINLGFSRQIFEIWSNLKVNENPSIGEAELFRADRQTDRTRLTVAFRSFAIALNKMITDRL